METAEEHVSLYLEGIAPNARKKDLLLLQRHFFDCILYSLAFSREEEATNAWQALSRSAMNLGISLHDLRHTLKHIDEDYLERVLFITHVSQLPWRRNLETLGRKAWTSIKEHVEMAERYSPKGFSAGKIDHILEKLLDRQSMMMHQNAIDELLHKLLVPSFQKKMRMPPKHLWYLEDFVALHMNRETYTSCNVPSTEITSVIAFRKSMEQIKEIIMSHERPTQERLLPFMTPLFDAAKFYVLVATYLQFRLEFLKTQDTPCLIKES